MDGWRFMTSQTTIKPRTPGIQLRRRHVMPPTRVLPQINHRADSSGQGRDPNGHFGSMQSCHCDYQPGSVMCAPNQAKPTRNAAQLTSRRSTSSASSPSCRTPCSACSDPSSWPPGRQSSRLAGVPMKVSASNMPGLYMGPRLTLSMVLCRMILVSSSCC